MSNKSQLYKAIAIPNCRVLEIGVAEGNTMVELLKRNPTLTYLGIDPWKWSIELTQPPHGLSQLKSQEDIDKWYEGVLRLLEDFDGRGEIIKGTSKEIIPQLTELFDVIHIDGDHTYEGCKWDIDNTISLLKEDGVMVIDDVHFWPGCTQAWKESKEEYQHISILP